MADSGERRIDVAELERAIRATDRAAWLVPPRILRRLIKRDRGMTRAGLQVPHRHVYATSGEALRAAVDGEELGIASDHDWPAHAILIERPDPSDLAATDRDVALGDAWRMLFHARVHLEIEQSLASDPMSANDLPRRIERLGRTEFDEIRTVLRQEGLLLPPGDDHTTYVEFAAYYLELRGFAPALLPHTFPGIDDLKGVDELLAEDVDATALMAATRPPEAPWPAVDVVLPGSEEVEEGPEPETEELETLEPATGASRRLMHRATVAGERGNVVRAAILRTEAARRAPPQLAESVRVGARNELDRLTRRLQRALGFDDAEADRWRRALPALLERSARGFWTAEARLLYDLQKVCVDHEREVFTIDLVEWVASWGARPIRRYQPYLREVMIAHHLRSASRRLSAVRLASEERTRLAGLLHPAVARAEGVLRERLRGPIDATLTTTGFVPASLPERVAYRKLVEELLDRIAGRGFLSLGDLRDACSRSQLKLPDLAGPTEFLAGDRLLQADEALARSLDGVYRRGEIYLRWLQRFSSLAFGTALGRFLTSYIALPYGGAYIVLEGLQHLVDAVVYRLGGGHVHIMNYPSLAVLGTVALGVIDFPRFRQQFVWAMRAVGRALRLILYDWLAWLLGHPLFRLLFAGRFATLVWRFVLKPALISAPVWILARALGLSPRASAILGAVVLVEASVAVNSRIGRHVEEILADEAVRAWRQLYRDLVPGLYRLVVATFDAILEAVDRLLYAVDEWLRFRSGQARSKLAIKAVLGAGWFFVAYLVRIYVNLLIEPQVNPIKHFPVVTVSHKIILPLSKDLTLLLAAPLMPLGKVAALFIAGTTVLLLPGVFGFLVWELKENWRLYEANRRATLGRVIVGSHGETIGRLLRPGFHSGTLPKVFAKIRRGERRWLREGRERSVIRHRESLHHVEEAIVRFVERELLALLHESRSLGPLEIEAGELSVSTNRIRVELRAGAAPGEVLRLEIEERSGRLIAEVAEPGWLAGLSEQERRVLTTALVGFFKLGGIEWVRVPPRVDASPAATADGKPPDDAPLIAFHRVTVSWRRWVEAWQKDQDGQAWSPRFTEGLRILPLSTYGEEQRPSHR